jgi:hypothetical protein
MTNLHSITQVVEVLRVVFRLRRLPRNQSIISYKQSNYIFELLFSATSCCQPQLPPPQLTQALQVLIHALDFGFQPIR